MKYNLRILSNFGLALIFIFSLLLNPVLAQISETPGDVPVSEAPYFYLETTFIDLGEDKNSGSYKIFAQSSVNWQTTSSAIDQKILTLSKISGQGPAEINFSVDKSKLGSGWHDLWVNYSWQATYQGTEIIGSDWLTIRVYVAPAHLPANETTEPTPETPSTAPTPLLPEEKPSFVEEEERETAFQQKSFFEKIVDFIKDILGKKITEKPPSLEDKEPQKGVTEGNDSKDGLRTKECEPEGAIRESSQKSKNFHLLREDSQVKVTVVTNAELFAEATQGMAEIFRKPEKIKDTLEKDIGVKLPEGAGTLAIDMMFETLDIGATILENVKWVGWLATTFWAIITVDVHSAQAVDINEVNTTICRDGKWVQEVICKIKYGNTSGGCGYQIGNIVGTHGRELGGNIADLLDNKKDKKIGEEPWRELGGDTTDLLDNQFIDKTKFQQKVDELTKKCLAKLAKGAEVLGGSVPYGTTDLETYLQGCDVIDVIKD